jgi:predicted nicotinamide N-methyase
MTPVLQSFKVTSREPTNLLFLSMVVAVSGVVVIFLPSADSFLPSKRTRIRRPSFHLYSTIPNDASSKEARQEHTLCLAKSGREVTLISRTLTIDMDLIPNITVWEWKHPSEVVSAYWDAQTHQMTTMTASSSAFTSKDPSHNALLDPFGFMTWPGSVKAAQELCRHAETAVQGQNVVVLGAGVGVETQAAAILGAKQVKSTDIHPTTLQQLQLGIDRENRIPEGVVETQILDLFDSKQALPNPCNLLVVADVLYNEQLATQVCRRCAEAYQQNPNLRLLITDSQRFVPRFIQELNVELKAVALLRNTDFKEVHWEVETMRGFTGSGVMIDDDQTYDVKVQHLWFGL